MGDSTEEEPIEVRLINISDIVWEKDTTDNNAVIEDVSLPIPKTCAFSPSKSCEGFIAFPPSASSVKSSIRPTSKVVKSSTQGTGQRIVVVKRIGVPSQENNVDNSEVWKNSNLPQSVSEANEPHQPNTIDETGNIFGTLLVPPTNFFPHLTEKFSDRFFPVYEKCGYATSLSDADEILNEFQAMTGSKFVVAQMPKLFGQLSTQRELLANKSKKTKGLPPILFSDPSLRKQTKSHEQFACRIQEEGVPFISFGSRLLKCHRCGYHNGTLKKLAERRDYIKQRELAAERIEGFSLKPSQRSRRPRDSKKVFCPAHIVQRDVLLFPSHAVDVSKYAPNMRSSTNNYTYRLECQEKRGEIYEFLSEGGEGERRVYVDFVNTSHNHPLFEDNNTTTNSKQRAVKTAVTTCVERTRQHPAAEDVAANMAALGQRLAADCNVLYGELDTLVANMRRETEQVESAALLVRVKARLLQALDLLKSDLPEVHMDQGGPMEVGGGAAL